MWSWCHCMCPLQVIRTLDPKQNQGSGPEVQALKNQLQEKERMLHSLEVVSLAIKNQFRGKLIKHKGKRWTTACNFKDSHIASFFVALCFLQTERDGQDKDSERLWGETDSVSLVQYGKKDIHSLKLWHKSQLTPVMSCLFFKWEYTIMYSWNLWTRRVKIQS